MKHLYELLITYANDSCEKLPFGQYSAVRDFYQHSISYSGDRIRRVEVRDNYHGGLRAIWDASWADESKAAGLAS